MTDYQTLNAQLRALIGGVPHRVANLANAAALLYHTLDGLNWAGFYLLSEDVLVLGPFQGKPACIEIPVGRGVCGTAVACDSASNSEIVVPICVEGRIVGVLDLDSPYVGRFTEEDQAGLEEFVRILGAEVWQANPAPIGKGREH